MDLLVNDFIKDNGNYGEAKNKLISMALSNELPFPFKKTYLPSPRELFNELKKSNISYEYEPYRLKSYYPKYNLYLPPLYKNQPTYILLEENHEYDNLSDYFIENVRLRGRRADQVVSPLESWEDKNILDKVFAEVLTKERINNKTIREVFSTVVSENKTFLLSWVKGLLQLTGNDKSDKKFLDISAGWGDRLLTAMSLNMEYLGFDPNPDLIVHHNEMIKMFGNGHQQVIQEPFETADIPNDYYDVVLSSPPYFDLEIYDTSDNSRQSVESFPTFEKWMVRFLFVSIVKCWEALKDGGYLILHLGDTRTLNMCEATNLFIESFNNSEWMGTVGVYGGSFNNKRPVWIWRKGAKKIWKTPNIEYQFYENLKVSNVIRKLLNTYPEIAKELFNYDAEGLFEKLPIIVNNIEQIRKMLYPINISKFFLYNLSFDAVFLTYWVTIVKRAIPDYNQSNSIDGQILRKQIYEYFKNNTPEDKDSYTLNQIAKIFDDDLLLSAISKMYNDVDFSGDFAKWAIHTLNNSSNFFIRENNYNILISNLKEKIAGELVDHYLGDKFYMTVMNELSNELKQNLIQTIERLMLD